MQKGCFHFSAVKSISFSIGGIQLDELDKTAFGETAIDSGDLGLDTDTDTSTTIVAPLDSLAFQSTKAR